jgi:hypothetical protein
MNRSLSVLAVVLLACASWAAPAPVPFVTGWGYPVNPDSDCKIRRSNYALTIEMPGGDHDFDPLRKRLNAPRLLRDMEGDFEIQVRVQMDCRLPAQSTVTGHPSCVAAGFLLIPPKNYSLNQYSPIYIRFEYGVSREGIGVDGYAALKTLDRQQREATDIWVGADGYIGQKTLICKAGRQMRDFWDILDSKWLLPKKSDNVHLRLERRDVRFYFSISPDGEKWTELIMRSGPPAKLKLGLAAYSTSSEPSKVRFDRLKLIRLRKKEH